MKLLATGRRTMMVATLVLLAVGIGCGGKNRGPVGITGMPRTINVRDWPFWLDIPIQTQDLERIWRTSIDIVSERHAMSVMDKESGYIRTEWRPDPARTEESRYTLRIRLAESKIRMGIEVRELPSMRYVTVLNNTPATPWTSMYQELRDRLATVR